MEMNHFNVLKENKQASVNTIKNLIGEYFQNHKAKISYAFLTTYDGMDITVLEDLLLSLPGGNKLIRSGDYDVYCGAKGKLFGIEGSYLAEMVLSHVHRVCVEGAFHPKIYLFYYVPEGEEEERIFLIIASKNITKASFLDAYACFEGVKTKENNRNGSQLKDILTAESFWGEESLTKQVKETLADLDEYHFTCFDKEAEVSFHRPDENLLNAILQQEKGGSSIIVVSPFVTDEIWKESPVCLYTLEETAKSLSGEPSEGIYCLNDISLDGIPSLHGKVYIKHRNQNTQVWIGSANFTASAFSNRNSEILSCLRYHDPKQSIYKELKQSFAQKVKEDIPVWREVHCTSADRDNAKKEKILIPMRIYKELDKKLAVVPKKIDAEGHWEYRYNEIKISSVSITEISPQTSLPTRNGSVSFVYAQGDKTVEGNWSFDLLSKIADDTIKEEYEQALKAHVESECKKRNEKLLTHGRYAGAIRKTPEKSNVSEESDKSGIKARPLTRKATLFDVVLQKKMHETKEEIREFLLRYRNNFVGEINDEEERLIEIFMEE